MLYGHDRRTLDGWGLKEMADVTVDASPATLRVLAAFLRDAADAMERADADGTLSTSWHRHAPPEVAEALGGDLIVTPGDCERRVDPKVLFVGEMRPRP